MSHLEAQVASLQQSLLQAKTLMHIELQDAVAGQNQANKTVKVIKGSFAILAVDWQSDSMMRTCCQPFANQNQGFASCSWVFPVARTATWPP